MRIATLLLTLTLATSAVAGEVFIPATFRGPGAAGSQWRTEISVSNISTQTQAPVELAITLHREGAAPMSLYMTLTQMEVMSVPDALRDWFDVETGGGLIRVTWADPRARIAARARIYNAGAGGEYGQGVPAFRKEALVSDVFLPGLSGIDGNRTNVGIANPHAREIVAWVTLYDTAGLSRGSFTYAVPPRSFRQLNDIFSHFGTGPLHAAMVRVTGFDSTLYAYASVVRNDTGDATFVTPAE